MMMMKHNPTSIQPNPQSIMQLPNRALQPHLTTPRLPLVSCQAWPWQNPPSPVRASDGVRCKANG